MKADRQSTPAGAAAPRARRARRAVAVTALLMVTAAACSVWQGAPTGPAASARAADGTYQAALEDAAKRRRSSAVMADAAPGSWSRRAAQASAELAYAELTGDYAAYEAADKTLGQAFAVARKSIDDEHVGPLLLQAQLHYELHRLEPALTSLRAFETQAEFLHDQNLLAEIASLRGAVVFAQGRYQEGLASMRRAIDLDPLPGYKQRLAGALVNVGREDEARALLDETEPLTTTPRARARLEMTRAKMALDRGKRAEGRRHLERARAAFPGFWQVEEHIAELDAEEGQTSRAVEAYRALVDKTGDPEFMDALSRLLADGSPEEAKRLASLSEAIYRERLVRLPEASYGHALEHYLWMVPDRARAVDVAERNRALRPNGEARTRLAQAYLRAGRVAEACAEARDVVEGEWVSAESYATAAVALRAAGDPQAALWEQKAKAINPHAMDEIDWLAAL